MRKLILSVNASFDGFVGGPDGDMSWMVDDEDMDHEFTTALRHRADTMLAGRATYESFAGAWPQIARSSELTPEMAAFARGMLETPIVVFSRGEPVLDMPNARLAERPLAEEVAALKDQPGGDIAVFGGASIVGALVGLGLVDEFWVKVEPVAIGRGLPIFDQLSGPLDLKLAWSKVSPSGVVGLRYTAARPTDEIVRNRWAQKAAQSSQAVSSQAVSQEAV